MAGRRAALSAIAACLIAGISATPGVWTDLYKFPFTGTPLPLALAIACPNTESCFVAGSHGNDAVAVYQGEVKDNLKPLNKTKMEGHSALILAMAMHGKTGVTAGLGALKDPGMLYTADQGEEWKASFDLNLVTGQDAEFMPGGAMDHYAFIGSTGFGNGVAVTTNGGRSWKAHDWAKNLKGLPAGASARYGSFPSTSTWFVGAGSFPGNNSVEGIHSYSSVLHFNATSGKHILGRLPESVVGAAGGYSAALTKTSDGGSTWEVLYASTGDFYFNDVHCLSTTACLAVGEGFSDGAAPGGRIFMTTDGKKFTQVLFDQSPKTSMTWVRMTSATDAWVGGATTNAHGDIEACFWYSKDGGKTWTKQDTLRHIGAILAMDFASPKLGFAIGITTVELTTFLKYQG